MENTCYLFFHTWIHLDIRSFNVKYLHPKDEHDTDSSTGINNSYYYVQNIRLNTHTHITVCVLLILEGLRRTVSGSSGVLEEGWRRFLRHAVDDRHVHQPSRFLPYRHALAGSPRFPPPTSPTWQPHKTFSSSGESLFTERCSWGWLQYRS